jgi:hypothetical protein
MLFYHSFFFKWSKNSVKNKGSLAFIAMLLLMAGVESNPGPDPCPADVSQIKIFSLIF